jgi:hypothetical protein
MPPLFRELFLPAFFALLAFAEARAAIPPEQIEFFEKRIRPVLAQECYECHSSTGKRKGGLALDHRDGWKKGGDSGDAIVPGDPAASLLLRTIRHTEPDLEMPRNGAKLEERVVRDFEAWIAMGAPDPRDRPPTKDELARDTDWTAIRERRKGWWSFQPIASPAPPAVADAAWPGNDVDRFLLTQMEAAGLRPAPDAAPALLLRRLSYVLTGLPPTPEEVESFEREAIADRQSAIENLAARLLASPRFGEKWARHWMDWVRYAETHGSEGDPAIPFAWRYRDYLIRALNADVHYPQLVREHLAGDLLENPRVDRERGINESALGPAHLRMVLHGFTPTDALDEQATFIDNAIDTVSKAFLGLTVSCARCHDHKFDPVSDEDFYALYGIFASSRPALIDANLPERQTLHADALAALKPRLRAALAEAWLRDLPHAAERLRTWQPADEKERAVLLDADASPLAAWLRLTALAPQKWPGEWQRLARQSAQHRERLAAFRAQPALQRWDLRTDDDFRRWFADGTGLKQGPTGAGEFSIAPEGDRIVGDLLPAGVFSHLLSTKHRAVLGSPRFPAQGGKLWTRVRGDGNARIRYVVRDYPRSGLIFPKIDLAGGAEQWVSWPLDYWKGDTVHVELATESDQPVETKRVERSWFGVAEVIYSPDNATLAPPVPGAPLHALCAENEPAPAFPEDLAALYTRVLRRSIEAWRDGRVSDDEAAFLDAFLRRDLLPNRLAELPEAAPLVAEYRRLENEIPVPTRVPGVTEGFAFDQPLFTRGNHKQPAAPVPRRFLEVIDPTPYALDEKRSGRRELAESFVAAENPLLARVIVNRLWHHVFGRGLVATPDNFGRLGEPPTHPELLDFLAARFIAEGGSLKKMIRLLVTSRAFALDARASEDATARDPENRLLTHWTTRRLEAEAIRDSMLALSGKLDLAGGEPGDGSSPRRSVYVKVVRNNLDPFLSAFDWPVPAATRGRRDSTNVPAQALALMNDGAVTKWAADWSRRILEDSRFPTDETRLARLFAEAFGRPPTRAETDRALVFLRENAPATKPAEAWRHLTQALFNAKEFIYLR